MRVNSINNFNQTFTSFKVSERGAKELAKEFTKNPDNEKRIVENVIKPLAYTESSVIYDGDGNVILCPARGTKYYKVLDTQVEVNKSFPNFEIKVPTMDLGSGDIIPFYVASIESDPDEIDLSILKNRLEMAKRVANIMDVADRYYEACNLSGDPATQQQFNENKLKRLYLV